MNLEEFLAFAFVSCIFYKSTIYLLRYAEALEKRGRLKLSKLITFACYPLYIFGILGVFTIGILDEYEGKRSFRIHQTQASEIRDLAKAEASHNRWFQYKTAAFYNAPGASAAYQKISSKIQEAKESKDDWYVKHLETNGLARGDPDFFDFDTWLQQEYYKLGL